MGIGGFRRLRQQDADAIAALYALGAKQVGGLVGPVAELAVGELSVAIRAGVDQRQPVRLSRRPAVADIDADIIEIRNVPAETAAQLLIGRCARQHGRLLFQAAAARLHGLQCGKLRRQRIRRIVLDVEPDQRRQRYAKIGGAAGAVD